MCQLLNILVKSSREGCGRAKTMSQCHTGTQIIDAGWLKTGVSWTLTSSPIARRHGHAGRVFRVQAHVPAKGL